MNPQDNNTTVDLGDENKSSADSTVNEAPQPFAFLQPFGEEGVGVCDLEGKCS